jgi:ATPase family associated with various cellular activities (AAA)/Winged helix domain, variant
VDAGGLDLVTGVDWSEANQRYLSAAIASVGAALERHAGQTAEDEATLENRLRAAAGELPAQSALDQVSRAFSLSRFERDILVLCAGVELDASFAARWRTSVTFSLALAALPDAHWSALAPGAPLRRWRLVKLGAGSTVATSPLGIDERILHHLAGVSYLDDLLLGLVEPVAAQPSVSEAHETLGEQVAGYWRRSLTSPPIAQLVGSDAEALRAVASVACRTLGLGLCAVRGHDLPSTAAERDTVARLWEREAILSGAALLIELGADDGREVERTATVFTETVGGYVLLGVRDPIVAGHRTTLSVNVSAPPREQRLSLWRECLLGLAEQLNGEIDAASLQFDLPPSSLDAVRMRLADDGGSRKSLWEACREQARARLVDLAERIEPAAGWQDLVLPELQLETLREIAIHVRRRTKVYDDWGFATSGARGLGITALFAGPSGTGKTMAAEVLAQELQLDLFRIDLSQVVSKYIGETEKNLRRVFDAAEAGGAVLLFDEADALFGKRSEVRDSHDRYANIEVSYLLQRMEAYRGLAILTTNRRDALDPAFLRRLRFVVQFPFPDAGHRAEIWRRIFPLQTPTEGLDPDRLARLSVAGGNIRNIAVGAAFLAADAGERVQMEHVLRAARREYAKLDRPLTSAESGGRR